MCCRIYRTTYIVNLNSKKNFVGRFVTSFSLLIFSIEFILCSWFKRFNPVHDRTATSEVDPRFTISTMKYRKTSPIWFTKIIMLSVPGYENLESIQEIIQEISWLRVKPKIAYLSLAYSIFLRDAMEAFPWSLEFHPPKGLA